MQTQSDDSPDFRGLIEAIADAVCKKLLPILKQINDKNDVGVLVGAYQISRYMGLKYTLRKTGSNSALGVHSSTLKRWYRELGFPLNKNPRGRWWITKTAVDKWMFERGTLMRKLKELGYKCVSGVGKGGYTHDAQPEKYKPEERAHAARELIKDRVKRELRNGRYFNSACTRVKVICMVKKR
jgi:hypothetical protein